MNFFGFDRLSLGHFPTPLHHLPRLSKRLKGPEIYIKRDDCTGLAGGGNKVRKLAFLLADALQQGADCIITQGAIQSNHARQTAAACAKLGLSCYVLLEDRTGEGDTEFYENGNVLLDQILGAHVSIYPGGTDMSQVMSDQAQLFLEQGKKPYIIPGGGSNAIGGLGYVQALQEIFDDASSLNISIDHIVHATGSAGTQAGLVAGMRYFNQNIDITGISVRFSQALQQERVLSLANKVLSQLDDKRTISAEHVVVNDKFVGKGYGIPGHDTLEAIKVFAQDEGILLDPVYTGKAAAGLIQLIKEGSFKAGQNVLFLHTGGAQSLAGYSQWFDFPAVTKHNI